MHTGQDQSPAAIRFEHGAQMWQRLCEKWDAAMKRAQRTADYSQAAGADLTLAICKWEHSRPESVVSLLTRRA